MDEHDGPGAPQSVEAGREGFVSSSAASLCACWPRCLTSGPASDGRTRINGCLLRLDGPSARFVAGVSRSIRLADLLAQSDDDAFRPSDVAKPICVLVLHHFANQL